MSVSPAASVMATVMASAGPMVWIMPKLAAAMAERPTMTVAALAVMTAPMRPTVTTAARSRATRPSSSR